MGTSPAACRGDFCGGVAGDGEDPARSFVNDEDVAVDGEIGRPFDGELFGSVDDSERLQIAVAAEAQGEVLFAVQQPGVARPGREKDEGPQRDDVRIS